MYVTRQFLVFATLLAITAAASTPAAPSADQILSECAAGADSLQLILRDAADGKPVLAISAGNRSSRQSFNLQTPCPEQLNRKPSVPLAIEASDPRNASNLVARFGLDSESGDAKWIGVWLAKSGTRWTLRGEWSVEKFNHKELGEKNEVQSFAFNTDGSFSRRTSRNNIEGVQTTCPQGCCKIWQSRTLVTEDVETLAWNESERSTERKSYQRWYVTQYGDSLLSIATKVLGSAERMSTLYYFNPQLQKQTTLEQGQRVLVEKVPR